MAPDLGLTSWEAVEATPLRDDAIDRARLLVAVALHLEMRADVAAVFSMPGHDAHTLLVTVDAT